MNQSQVPLQDLIMEKIWYPESWLVKLCSTLLTELLDSLSCNPQHDKPPKPCVQQFVYWDI